jgi:hypothetical protein
MFVNIGNQEIGQTNQVYLVVKRQCSLKQNIFMSSYLFNVHRLGLKTSHNISSWIWNSLASNYDFEIFSTLLNTSLDRCSESGEKPCGQCDVQQCLYVPNNMCWPTKNNFFPWEYFDLHSNNPRNGFIVAFDPIIWSVHTWISSPGSEIKRFFYTLNGKSYTTTINPQANYLLVSYSYDFFNVQVILWSNLDNLLGDT